jgi:hypothetical protein
MWTLQKLLWFECLKKRKQAQFRDPYAHFKKNKKRKRKRYDYAPIEQFYFETMNTSIPTDTGHMNPKNQRNIHLISSSHTDYLQHMRSLLEKFRARRPVGYVPKPPSNFYLVSKTVECIARTCYGSDYDRIIRYDIPCRRNSEQVYMECDMLRTPPPGQSTVFVGEIKCYAVRKPSATMQLSGRCKILAQKFKHVVPILIHVKLSSMTKTQDMKCPEFRLTGQKDFPVITISLSFKDVLDYAAEACVQYDEKVMMAAYAEARELVKQRNLYKKNKKLQKQAQNENSCI